MADRSIGIQGTGRPTLYLVRHAHTPMNSGGEDIERVRGWADAPVDEQGKQQSEQLAAKFYGLPVHTVASSPMQRTLSTAQSIAKATGAQVFPTQHLMPWNTGVLTGQPVHQVMPEVIHYMMHPQEKVPQGESYGDFYQRWKNALHTMLQFAQQYPKEAHVGVTHSRNIAAVPSILSGGHEPIVPGGGPKTGGITKIELGDDGQWHHNVG